MSGMKAISQSQVWSISKTDNTITSDVSSTPHHILVFCPFGDLSCKALMGRAGGRGGLLSSLVGICRLAEMKVPSVFIGWLRCYAAFLIKLEVRRRV